MKTFSPKEFTINSYRVLKMRERWDNRLVFPLSNPLESYRSGQLQFYLEVKLFSVALLLHVCAEVNRPQCSDDILWNLHSRVEGSHNQDKIAVLINAVQRVNNGQWVIERVPSIVGLYPLDYPQGIGGRDSLYFSVIFGNFVFRRWPGDENGKGNRQRFGSPVAFSGEKPCNMVERGPEMVGNLSSKDAKSRRNPAPCVEFNPLIERLVLVFTASPCGAFFQECGDFSVEVADVFVGPF